MFCTFCVIVIMATLVVFIDAESYCDMKSCGNRPHTRCLYQSPKPSDRCGKVFTSELTQSDIKEILDAHNKLRARVANGEETHGNPGPQPAATNLRPLKWDRELADTAQTWTNQCNFGHDNCRNSQRFYVGQNVAMSYESRKASKLLGELVRGWYDEVRLFNNSQVKEFSFWDKTAHYTQFVWAQTTALGCGAVRFNNDNYWNKTYLVCNYGPGGNMVGSRIYETR